MVNVGDFADDSASDVSSGENVDDDSQPGDLQSYYEDDRNVPPQEKQQYLMTLCFSSIEGFTTDVLPYSHRLFDKQKKKFKATVNLLKKEIKRRKPDFKGLSNKKADDLIAILKGNDMKLGEKDKRFIVNMENQLKTSLQKVIDESASDSPSGNVNIGIGDKYRLMEAMLCDEAKAKLASSQEWPPSINGPGLCSALGCENPPSQSPLQLSLAVGGEATACFSLMQKLWRMHNVLTSWVALSTETFTGRALRRTPHL